MSKFSITEHSSIYLYGAASIGKIVYENLLKMGYSVTGFIDKRADELKTFLNCPVISLSDVVTLDKEAVIVVSVKNVFEHENIVQSLLEKNVHNLIFKPKSVLENRATEQETRIGDIYDALLEAQETDLTNIIKTFTVSGYYYKDYALQFEEGEQCIALIPIPFVYTNDYNPSLHKWGNVNLFGFFTHDEFFRFLAGDKETSIEHYVNEYCTYTATIQKDIEITPQWKTNVVRNRAMIYEQMSLTLEIDKDFFIRNAATAKWNPKRKYFNLTSGKHRCMFLVSKGYKFLPLKILKKDYEKFCNMVQFAELKTYLQERCINSYEGIINHPYMYKFTESGAEYMYHTIHMLVNFIAKQVYQKEQKVDFSNLVIVDKMQRYHCLTRIFAKMGATVFREKSDELERAIDALEAVLITEMKEEPEVADVYFMTYNSEEDLAQVVELSRKALVILETGNEVPKFNEEFDIKLITRGYMKEEIHYVYIIRRR